MANYTRILDVMLEKGMRPVELSNKMGMSKQYINGYLNGHVSPSVKKLKDFAAALGCTTAELIDDFPEAIKQYEEKKGAQ